MGKRYIANDTDRTIFVGGTMIPPGEGREVDTQFLPPSDTADTAAALADATGSGDSAGGGPTDAALAANIADLQGKPLKQLVPLLAEASDATLAALQAAEVATETPRVTLLNAIAALQLQRADGRMLARAVGNLGTTGASTDAGEASGAGA